MHKRESAFLLLGSNIGDGKSQIKKAKAELARLKIVVVKESAFYRTEPVGIKDQDDFINQIVRIKTSLTPLQLLIFIKNIEQKLGRLPRAKGGPREIDIDILFYNDIILNSPDLVIPHPAIQERLFILVPFTEIEGDFIHPVLKKTMSELLSECKGKERVDKIR